MSYSLRDDQDGTIRNRFDLQRAQIARLEIVIEECNSFFLRLESGNLSSDVLRRHFPNSVHRLAYEYLKLIQTHHGKLQETHEVYAGRMEQDGIDLQRRIPRLLEDAKTLQEILHDASIHLFNQPLSTRLHPQSARPESNTDLRDNEDVIWQSLPYAAQETHATTSYPPSPLSSSPPSSPRVVHSDDLPEMQDHGEENSRDTVNTRDRWTDRSRAAWAFLEKIRLKLASQPKEIRESALALFNDWYSSSIDSFLFVEMFCPLFESHPDILESVNSISAMMKPAPIELFVSVSSANRVTLVTAVSADREGRIFPISRAAKENPFYIINTRQIHELLSASTANSQWEGFTASLSSLWAPCIMQLLQVEYETRATDVDYSKRCLSLMQKLMKSYRSLPPSFILDDLVREGQNPVSGGGFADIWKGRMDGQVVCLKVLRYFLDQGDRDVLFNRLCHEAFLWKRLRHPNILPFLGVNTSLFAPSFCMISPWMNNGHIMNFVKAHPNHDRYVLISEVAEGIRYLHELDPPIVHGDIKGSNILVNDENTCCLADFGLAVVSESHASSSNSLTGGGSIRWAPPEVFSPDRFPNCSKLARDVYSFACTVLEIITGMAPFSEPRLAEGAVIATVSSGGRPPRPKDNRWCTDSTWNFIEACWAEDTAKRPNAQDIVRLVYGLRPRT